MSFQYIKPTEEQIAKMQEFRDKFETLYSEIVRDDEIPNRRGFSNCLEKLEEASFWLNKTITLND